jgi:predicted XRE-type DNA-binding protein
MKDEIHPKELIWVGSSRKELREFPPRVRRAFGVGELNVKKNYERSSGNVFEDLGLPNSEQEMLKAKLTVQIHRIVKDRGLTQTEAAGLLGTTQAQMSALMRLRPVSVSVGRLMEFLTILGQDVKVTVKPAPARKAGHMSVVVAQ